MATGLTNPSPDQRAALASSAEFVLYVKTSLIAQAAALYTATLREDNPQLWTYVQIACVDGTLDGAPASQKTAELIAWHPAAPAAWFAANFDFSTINVTALDTAVLTAYKIIAGF